MTKFCAKGETVNMVLLDISTPRSPHDQGGHQECRETSGKPIHLSILLGGQPEVSGDRDHLEREVD